MLNDQKKKKLILRQQAMMCVEMYIDVALSGNDDIARESRSVIGALVDFRGEIPRSSGFSGFCKLAGKIDRMKKFGDTHLMACYILRSLSDRQHDAVVCNQTYRGRTKVAIDPFVPERRIEILWDDKRCADTLDCTVGTFRQRIVDGYTRMERWLSESQEGLKKRPKPLHSQS